MKSSFQRLVFALLLEAASGLSTRQVSFPLKSLGNENNVLQLRTAFQDVVDSSDFFVQTSLSERENSICSVPVLGNDITVKFNSDIEGSTRSGGNPSEFVLSVDASGREEFGWICVLFYENKNLFQDIVDTSNLRAAVIDHYNKQPPHPGFDATSARLANSRQIEDLFENTESAMSELERNGFLIMDNGPRSTKLGHEKLSQYLVEKTNQDDHVRTDSVHFLRRDEAKQCGFEQHFDILMGIASFLNENLIFRQSPYMAINPATEHRPLTIPDTLQLAEYGKGDFYKIHSDNSLTSNFVDDDESIGRIRSNFRHYTCILYCNDDWEKEDGGALRLYPHTRNLLNTEDAISQGYECIDVSPSNGRLIIFDSCLLHSVEKVDHSTKKRRALTLWITRPDDSGGVKGEQFF